MAKSKNANVPPALKKLLKNIGPQKVSLPKVKGTNRRPSNSRTIA